MNMNQYIKNFPVEEVVNLAGQITVRPGEIASKTLAQNDAISITLFAFDKGEEIYSKEAFKWLLVVVFPKGFEN